MVGRLIEAKLHDHLGEPKEDPQRHGGHDHAKASPQYHDGRGRIDKLSQRDGASAVARRHDQRNEQQYETTDHSANGCQIHALSPMVGRPSNGGPGHDGLGGPSYVRQSYVSNFDGQPVTWSLWKHRTPCKLLGWPSRGWSPSQPIG